MLAKEIKISKVELQYWSQPKRRRIKVHLSNGTKVYIERSWEAWQQYGGTTQELFITQPIARDYNGWLHEGLEEDD